MMIVRDTIYCDIAHYGCDLDNSGYSEVEGCVEFPAKAEDGIAGFVRLRGLQKMSSSLFFRSVFGVLNFTTGGSVYTMFPK
jgi:hypothetical protein